MAYSPQSINPLDLKPSTGIGVALPFNVDSAFRTVYTTQEQIKYNLINYLLTDKGERLFQPQFGLGLRRKIFEQLSEDTLENLKGMITSGIETSFPNVQVVDIMFTPYPDSNTLSVSFSYIIVTTGVKDEITINLENV